jgi:predicted GNAT family N-acyltransferase
LEEAITIRALKPGEEAEACRVIARVFDEFVAPEYPAAGVSEFHRYANAEAMAQRITQGELVLVAAENDRIVGVLEMRGHDHLAMLFVEPAGRGIGRKLVEHALVACASRQPRAESIRVHASRYAVPFYLALGFVPEGSERTENGITYLPLVLHKVAVRDSTAG